MILLPAMSCSDGVWILTRPCLCPSYPSKCGFFFFFLVVKIFLLDFRLVSEIVSLYVVVILMCLWEGVSQGSSYCAILSSSLNRNQFKFLNSAWKLVGIE